MIPNKTESNTLHNWHQVQQNKQQEWKKIIAAL